MWSYEVWSELDAQMFMIYWRMTCILPTTWNVDFALADEREKNRMREKSDEHGALISKLQLGDDEMSMRLTFRWKGKRVLS
jgi:hypothetical protein